MICGLASGWQFPGSKKWHIVLIGQSVSDLLADSAGKTFSTRRN
jgi:hypothetical protein